MEKPSKLFSLMVTFMCTEGSDFFSRALSCVVPATPERVTATPHSCLISTRMDSHLHIKLQSLNADGEEAVVDLLAICFWIQVA